MNSERTLLVIDDDVEILSSIRRLFRGEYRVLTAQTVTEAYHILETETVQVVLTDQRMPQITGIEFLTGLRRTHPDIVRILLTGYSSIDGVVEAINDGNVYRYISKPWNPLDLKLFVLQAFECYETRREREALLEKLQAANSKLEIQNAALEHKNNELKLLDRMKSVFMEVVSHELNTPIAVILGYEYLLRRELVPAQNIVVAKSLSGIESSANRLRHISSRIFQMLTTEDPSITLNLEDVEIGSIIQGLRQYVDPFLARREQELVVIVQPQITSMRVDAEKIIDVLINLVMNAIKFSHDGQTITLLFLVVDATIEIEVRDHGIGIDSQDIEQVFAPFFSSFNSQYHSSGEYEFGKRGIGIGLALARRFVEMHGGEIRVTSTTNEGSTFQIILPQVPEEFDSSGELPSLRN